MLCCVIAACLLVKILVRWKALAKYLGFSAVDEQEEFGFIEYGELDTYES